MNDDSLDHFQLTVLDLWAGRLLYLGITGYPTCFINRYRHDVSRFQRSDGSYIELSCLRYGLRGTAATRVKLRSACG